MKFLRRFFSYTTTITTFTLIACAFWMSVTALENGESLSEHTVSCTTLWHVLIVGVLTGLSTSVFITGKEMSARKNVIMAVLQVISIYTIVLSCGYAFGWYGWGFSEVMFMVLTITIIYVLVYVFVYMYNRKVADIINDKLQERNKR